MTSLSPNVRIRGKPAPVDSSVIATCTGDESGSGGGVVSGTTGKQCDPIVPPINERTEHGKLLHETTEFWMNCRNCKGTVVWLGRRAAKKSTVVLAAPNNRGETLAAENLARREGMESWTDFRHAPDLSGADKLVINLHSGGASVVTNPLPMSAPSASGLGPATGVGIPGLVDYIKSLGFSGSEIELVVCNSGLPGAHAEQLSKQLPSVTVTGYNSQVTVKSFGHVYIGNKDAWISDFPATKTTYRDGKVLPE